MKKITRFLTLAALLFLSVNQMNAQTDTKDVQIARKRLRVGLDTAKYFTTTTHTVNSSSTHRQLPTAKAVWDAIVAGGGGGGGGISAGDKGDIDVIDPALNWKVDTSAIDSVKLATNSVQSTDIRDGQVWRADLANAIVDSSKLAPNAVTSTRIADGAVWMKKISQAGATSGQVIKWNGTNWAPAADVGGGSGDNWGSQVVQADATLSGTGITGNLLGLADNAVTNAKMADNAIGNTEMADNAVGSAEIINSSVALADLANMATGSFYYRKTAGSGAPEVNSLATVKTDLGLTGTNSGDQTITLTGDVTGSGTGSFAATIAPNAVGSAEITDASVALADLANMATGSFYYRKTAGSGAPEVNSLATVKTDLGLTGTNSGDQTITLTGEVTGTGTASFPATIASNAITNAKMADNSINTVEIVDAAVTMPKIAQSGALTGEVIKWNGVSWAPGSDVGGGSGDNWGSQVVQADATLSGTGITGNLLGLADNAVTNAKMADNAIGNTEMADNAVGSAEITDASVTLADLANMATGSFYYRKTAGSGAPEVNSLATVKTDLGLTGTNSGDQTITLTGDVTGSGTGSFAATIAPNAVGSAEITDASVALGDLANMATGSFYYRKTAGSGAPEVNSLATVKTDLGLTGTNSGDQTITLTGDVTGSGTGSFAATIADNSVDGTDIALGSDAQGDIMYYDGSNWVRLPPGTSGHFLQTQGPAANPTWATGGGGADNWGSQVVQADATLSGTGITGNLLGLADNAVTNAKMADNAIGNTEMADNAVGSAEITDASVTLADLANMATGSFYYRKTAGPGAPEVNSLATVKTDLGLTGTNSGDQTITLTGEVTGTGTASFPATIASNAITNAKMADNSVGSAEITDASVALADLANMATGSFYYRKTAGSGAPEVNSLATVKTDLGLTGTNSGDQTITLTGDVTGSGTGSFAATIADNSVDGTDIALGSDAQGDIMYYDGTNWVRLPPGTNGHYLKTQGAAANPIWAAITGGGTNYQTLEDENIAVTGRGTANFNQTTTINFTLNDDAANGETDILAAIRQNSLTDFEIGTDAIGYDELGIAAVGVENIDGAGFSAGEIMKFNGTAWEPSDDISGEPITMEEGTVVLANQFLDFIGSGITVTNGTTKSNITIAANLNAIADETTSGFYVRTGAGTAEIRTITAGSGITVVNGNGVAGNPTITAPESSVTDFTASGTYTVPTGAKSLTIICVGGGGGGGSGRKGANGSIRTGGAGGGPGGISIGDFDIVDLGNPATLSVTVAIGAAGGGAISANSTNGQAGSDGNASSVSASGTTILSASGGFGGGGGTTGAALGGAVALVGDLTGKIGANSNGTGVAGLDAQDNGNKCGGAGGAGGGITAANATSSGSAGGDGYYLLTAGGAGGGTGLSGGQGGTPALDQLTGGGGGGGGSKTAAGAAAGSGGTAGVGGGGGGGGAGTDAACNSGAGGTGLRGHVRIIAHM